MTDSPNTEIPETSPTPKKKKRSWVWHITSVFTMLLTLAIVGALAGVWWLLNSEKGLQFAITLPEKLQTGVYVQADSLKGTVWQGFQAENVLVQTESADINISHLDLAWTLKELQKKHLHINHLIAGDVHIQTKPTPPRPKDEALKMPESISLPVTVAVDKLQVGKITQGQTRFVHRVDANYRYDHAQHLLHIQSVKTDWSDSAGDLMLATAMPYALKGKLTSQGELDGIAVDNFLALSGSLNDIFLQTNIKGLGISLDADTHFRPFAPNIKDMIGHVKLVGEGINPRAFLNTLPQAKLRFHANVLPELGNVIALHGKLDWHNDQALPADKDGIPVRQMVGELMINESGAIEISKLNADLLQQGKVSIVGGIYTQKQTLNLTAKLHNVRSQDAITTPIDGVLNGALMAIGTFSQPQVRFNLNTGRADVGGLLKVHTDKTSQQRTLFIEDGDIRPQNGGKLKLSGSLELFKNQKLVATLNSEAFNPAKLYPNLPQGNINGDVKVHGELANTIYHAQMAFRPSTLSGAALSGKGDVSYQDAHLSRADLAVQLGNNHVNTSGSFGKKGDVLKVDINAPNLAQFGLGLNGLLVAKGSLKNRETSWTDIEADLTGQIRQLIVPNAVRIQTLDFVLKGSPDYNAPLMVMLDGKGLVSGDTAIDAVKANLNGTLRQHALQGSGSLKIDNKPLNVNVNAHGGLTEQNQWVGTVSQLDVDGALQLRLQNAMKLDAGAARVVMSAARWQALGGNLSLETFTWDKQNGLTTRGHADGLHLAQLHNFYQPPIEHNFVIASDWDLSYSNSPRGYLNVRQQAGDMKLPTERKPALELQKFIINTQLNQRGILNQISGTTRYGEVSGHFDILRQFGNGDLTTAPVTGSLRFYVNDLNSLKNILPVGQIVKGKLVGDLTISGILSDPKFNGVINGENLYYRNHEAGITLKDGTLKSHLNHRIWTIDALTFHRKGTATLTGTADYSGENPNVVANVVFNQYQALDQATRRLTVTGSTQLTYDGTTIALDGNLRTDEGKFGFQEGSAPTLDSDVVVLGETQPEKSASTPFKLNLVFDLNDKFYFGGDGLDVILGGKLTLTAKPHEDIQGVGSVHVVKGRYKAYGQDLVITKGVISFLGPLGQPNLNIRAERRASQVGAGVEVLGNLESPRITLVANEPMSEKDKLSWLILNRASSGSSTDNAALAAAAGAFLAGSLNDKVGLVDDFGLSSQQTRNAQTGEMNPAQQVLTFGKQLTRDLYMGYEAGLQSASQSVKLVYQLSKSFQAIARAGTESSGGEIKYVKRFDGFEFGKKKPKPQAEK